MATMTTEHLVESYLHRLGTAAGSLPVERREELVVEIRNHIEEALDDTGRDEVAIRNVLDRLGSPEEIVAAASPAAHPAPAARAGRLEIVAVIALVIPLIGWVLGLVLVAVSDAWSSRQKTIGFALALAPVLLAIVGGAEPTGPYEFIPLIVILLAGLPSATYLGSRLRKESRTV